MGYIKPRIYCIPFASGALSPLDATDYFCGCIAGGIWLTTYGSSSIYPPINGVIRAVLVSTQSFTTIGTNEDISVYIRVNDATDYLIETVGASTMVRTFRNDNLNIPITTADSFELKFVFPTWATNPAGFRVGGTCIIESG